MILKINDSNGTLQQILGPDDPHLQSFWVGYGFNVVPGANLNIQVQRGFAALLFSHSSGVLPKFIDDALARDGNGRVFLADQKIELATSQGQFTVSNLMYGGTLEVFCNNQMQQLVLFKFVNPAGSDFNDDKYNQDFPALDDHRFLRQTGTHQPWWLHEANDGTKASLCHTLALWHEDPFAVNQVNAANAAAKPLPQTSVNRLVFTRPFQRNSYFGQWLAQHNKHAIPNMTLSAKVRDNKNVDRIIMQVQINKDLFATAAARGVAMVANGVFLDLPYSDLLDRSWDTVLGPNGTVQDAFKKLLPLVQPAAARSEAAGNIGGMQTRPCTLREMASDDYDNAVLPHTDCGQEAFVLQF